MSLELPPQFSNKAGEPRSGFHRDLNEEPDREDAGDNPSFTCASCRACCCRLEVILTGDDDVPVEMIESDRWGGQVMTRLDDGWCVALDRNTMRCRIYEMRPVVCREFRLGASECLAERVALDAEQGESGRIVDRRVAE